MNGFRKNLRRINFNESSQYSSKVENPEKKKTFNKNTKVCYIEMKMFSDGLVLISDDEYLDSIGFDFNFI